MKSIKFKFPPPMVILECFFPTSICKCGSSVKFLKKKCVNPNCMNCEEGFPSKKYNPEYGYYNLNGDIILK